MRALIAQTFPAYTFAALDGLVLDDVIDLFAAAQWLHQHEARAARTPARKRRR